MEGVLDHTVARWGVTVSYDPARISSGEIARNITRQTGYRATLRRPKS